MPRHTWPPRQAVRLAVVLVALIGVVGFLGWLVGGGVAALGVLLGAVVGLGAAVADVGWAWRLALAAGASAFAVLGALTDGRSLAAGAVVAVAALAQVPFTVQGAKIAMMLPVVPALTASLDLPGPPAAFGGWLAVGTLAVAVLAALLGASGEARPTPRGEAVRHAVATAVVAGGGLAVARVLAIGHGYWFVIAVATVLAVSPDETGREAAERVAGTLGGALAAILLVAVLPAAVALGVAAALLVLSVAWAVAQQVRLSAAAATAVVVLLGSGGLVGPGAELAVERLLLTLVGAVLAAVTVAMLWRVDRTDRAGDDAQVAS
jgi:Fusaric acid resistance protein-like